MVDTATTAKRVRIKPAWLDALIPAQWFQVAERLAQIAYDYKVPDERMRVFLMAGSQMPGVPLLVAVEAMAKGEIEVTVQQRPQGEAPSGIILPSPAGRVKQNA